MHVINDKHCTTVCKQSHRTVKTGKMLGPADPSSQLKWTKSPEPSSTSKAQLLFLQYLENSTFVPQNPRKLSPCSSKTSKSPLFYSTFSNSVQIKFENFRRK